MAIPVLRRYVTPREWMGFMTDYTARQLLTSDHLAVWDVICGGGCSHPGGSEYSADTHLVFPYRGLYRFHVGGREAVAEPNQLLFINRAEEYRVSHPVDGGDGSLSLWFSETLLDELVPADRFRARRAPIFAGQQLGISPGVQSLLARLRHGLAAADRETLAFESLAIDVVSNVFGERVSRSGAARIGRRKIVDRAKLVLAADLSRRWCLADVAARVGVSPVYLTQLFQQVEGVPLYRYQLRLRLARALDLLPRCQDLTMLGLDLGFTSHSHFTAAFHRAYGVTPARYRVDTRPGVSSVQGRLS